MATETVFEKLAVALGLGLLVGLQRERAQSPLAGIRTIALITVCGAVFALLGREFGGLVVAAGVAAVAAILVVGNLPPAEPADREPGVTTEVAVLLMYGVGALVVVGPTAVAVAVGGCAALLLHFKEPLHRFVARIGESELKGIMQFVLVALVVWPVLPDHPLDQQGVINPTHVWFVVVLLVGLNLAGYAAARVVGGRKGTLVSGFLGGLVSSTATTVSYARRDRATGATGGVPDAGTVIVLASAVSVARVMVEVAVVAPGRFTAIAPRLGLLLGCLAIIAAAMYLFTRRGVSTPIEPRNPAELKSALLFGGLYVLVTWGVAVAKDLFGAAGLFGVAVLSGLHDVDAITLSTATLVEQEKLEPALGSRLILAGVVSNVGWKGVLAVLFGGRRMLRMVAAPFLIAVAVGLLLQWLG